MASSKVFVTVINITTALLLVFIFINDSQVTAKRKLNCVRCGKVCNQPGRSEWNYCQRCATVCDTTSMQKDPWIIKSQDKKRQYNETEAEVPVDKMAVETNMMGRSMGDADSVTSSSITAMEWWGR